MSLPTEPHTLVHKKNCKCPICFTRPHTTEEYRVSNYDLVMNKQALDSWIVARLFYGVPKKMNTVYRDIRTLDLVFTYDPEVEALSHQEQKEE